MNIGKKNIKNVSSDIYLNQILEINISQENKLKFIIQLLKFIVIAIAWQLKKYNWI